MKDIKIKKKYIIIMVITLIVGVGAVTLAYFQGNVINDLINGTTVSTGNIDVKISDTEIDASNVKPIYNGSVNYEDATFKKTFTVTNSGTLNTCTELYLKINFIEDSLKSTDFRYMVINDETGTTLEGNFSEASDGNDLKLGSLYFFEGETSKKYTMYIWIEYQESKDQMTMLNKTMNATLFVKGKDVKAKDACDNRDTFRITYVLNGGTGKKSEEVSKESSVTLYTPTNTDTDLIFGGWYSDKKKTIKVTSLSNINKDIKLYAMWTCTYSGDLVQGTEYTNGLYTYRYMQDGDYSFSGNKWKNMEIDGWGVQLTDKKSTEPVTSNVCTHINNKPVVSMSYMFASSHATTLDLNGLDTSSVTNMQNMFEGAETTLLDLSDLDTSGVTNMYYMFGYTLTDTLDLSNFDTSNVTNMGMMFCGSKIAVLDLSNFNTSSVTDMRGMFSNSKAYYIDVSSFNTSNVTDMSWMFHGSQVVELDLSNFDTSNVTNMSYMFFKSMAETIDLSNFNTSNVTTMNSMFYECQATTLDVSNFDTSKVTDMGWMFSDSKVTKLDLINFDTSKVTSMRCMFSYCSNIKTIYASDKFNTSKVTDSTSMFTNSTKLVGGSGTVYDANNVDITYARIDGGTSRPGYFTLKSN